MIRKASSEAPACGIVLGGDAGLGEGVEKGGLADVGQADDAAFETHGIPRKINPLCTIEPNTGVVEVPDPRKVRRSRKRLAHCADSPGFVLVLPREE